MTKNYLCLFILLTLGLLLGSCSGPSTHSFAQAAEGPIPAGHVRIEVERSSAFVGYAVGGYILDYPTDTPNGWLNVAGLEGRVDLLYLEVNGQVLYDIKKLSDYEKVLNVLTAAIVIFNPKLGPIPKLGVPVAGSKEDLRTKGSQVNVRGSLGPNGVLTWDRPSGPLLLEVVVDITDSINGKGGDWRGHSKEIQAEAGQVYRFFMDFSLDGPTLDLLEKE